MRRRIVERDLASRYLFTSCASKGERNDEQF